MHLPPTVALWLTVGFIVWLFRRDARERVNVSKALWIPLIWMLLITTRLPSQWFNVLGLPIVGHSMEEGNPVDATIYFSVIAAGFYILNQRRVSVTKVFQNNRWIAFYFAFCFIAITWSEFPFVAFKRWIKILGHPIMVLVVLTEPDPEQALVRLMRRTAYIVLPVSMLFIKYFEDLGRGYDEWSGEAVNIGITLDKNALGYDCLVLGFFFCWQFLGAWRTPPGPGRRRHLLWNAVFLYMIWWLLTAAHSSTSLVSLVVGVLVMLFLGFPFVNRSLVGTYLVAGVAVAVIAELCFGLSTMVIDLLGKDPTLTGRKKLWPELLALAGNPIIGTGFESFWLGERLRILWENHWWHPNEAHNGYLEIYLNLGIAGLMVLAGVFVAAFIRARLELLRNFEFGRFRLGFLAAVVFYNWTESAFKGLHPVWFVFYLIAMEYPRAASLPMAREKKSVSEDEDQVSMELRPVRQ